MKLNGKIAEIAEVKSGTSANGKDWARTTIILETPGYQGAIYKVVLNVNGVDRINKCKALVGTEVSVSYSLYAREWKGKWYNNVDLIGIEAVGASVEATDEPAPEEEPEYKDDLPF